MSRDGGDIHDPAAPALLHSPDRGAGDIHQPIHVDAAHFGKLGIVEGIERRPPEDSGIVHQQVHGTQRGLGLAYHRPGFIRQAHIPADGRRLPAALVNPGHHRFGQFPLLAIVDGDLDSLGGQPLGHRPSQASGCARYQRSAACQMHLGKAPLIRHRT
ncbi:MAG: hypothetical protein NTY38_25870 [Acidobacteria bacterium]|nr:hypothetical protein [Acidobacteriota bacterium]